MGYEYHNRRRNRYGKFDFTHHTCQIHVYCTANEIRTIRAAALEAAEDLSEYCRNAALERAKRIITENGENSINEEQSINGAQ